MNKKKKIIVASILLVSIILAGYFIYTKKFSANGITAVPPNTGRAFNGLDNQITIPNNSSLNITGDISIEGWIKTQVYANEANEPVIYKSTDNATGGFSLFIKGGKLCSYVENSAAKNLNDGILCSTGAIADGTWHHFALTNTGATTSTSSQNPNWKIYFDGVIDVTWGDYAPTVYAGTKTIGSINFNGSLSDLRIYNRAISSSEVNDAYSGIAPTVNSSLVGYWPLNDAGTTIVDHSSYGNNGTFSQSKAADTYTVSTAHPRIFLTPNKLTALRSYQSQNTAEWQRFLARVNDRMNINFETWNSSSGPTGNQWWSSSRDLALAYQITGNTDYADRAIAWLMPTMDSTNDSLLPQGDNNGYNYRYLDLAAESYDWLYSRMTIQQRQTAATYLMDQSDKIWSETNANRSANSWGLTAGGNNYFLGFMYTWMAALAVNGDGTDTGSNVRDGSNRAAYHVQLGLRKYRTIVQPYIDSFGQGGVFPESTSYDSITALCENLLAFNTATGNDLINEQGETFFHDSLLWRIYSASPDYHYHYQNGSQSRIYSGPIGDDDIERAFIPSSVGSDAAVDGYGRKWVDDVISNAVLPSYVLWNDTQGTDFLFYPQDTAAVDYKQSLPLSQFFSGPQIFIHRSDWTNNATYWGFTSGDIYESHQNMDMNGFSIYKGDFWLTASATAWSRTGLLQDSSSQNTLTIDGLGQTWQTPHAGNLGHAATTEKHETGDKYSYVVGQAAPAYVQGNGTNLLTDYTRKLVNLSDNLFIIYDRVNSVDANANKQWHLQTGTSLPTVSGNTYSFTNGTAKGFGKSLLPTSGTTLTPTTTNLDGSPTNSMVITTNNHQNQDYLLNTLEVAPTSQTTASASQVLTPSNGNMQGTEIVADNGWAVLIGKSDEVGGLVSYTTAAHRNHHLITDVVPSTAYTLTVENSSGTVLRTATINSTGQGTLRFDSNTSTEITYSLSEGNSLPVPNTPSITSPTNNQVINVGNPTITASAFSGGSGSQAASQWQISNNSGFTSTVVDSGEDTSHYTSFTPPNLSSGDYYVRVRFKDTGGTWSSYSGGVHFSVVTSLPVPNTPSITSPANNSTLSTNTPTITASTFSESSGSQLATQWQISTSNTFSTTVVDSGADTINLNSYQPTSLPNGSYYVQVRYEDRNSKWSAYSPPIHFTINISVAPVNPIPTVSAGENKTIYNGMSVVLSGAATGQTLITWSADNSVVFSLNKNTTSPTISCNVVGVHTVTLTATNSVGAAASSTMTLTVNKSGDINGDGVVNNDDFTILMYDWGKPKNSMTDLNSNGVVDNDDFTIMMYWWTNH